MPKTLISSDPTLQVRVARGTHDCYGVDKWWRSPICSARIRKGQTYVAKIERGIVKGEWGWLRDLRHYCANCAPLALEAVNVVEPPPPEPKPAPKPCTVPAIKLRTVIEHQEGRGVRLRQEMRGQVGWNHIGGMTVGESFHAELEREWCWNSTMFMQVYGGPTPRAGAERRWHV